MKAFILLGALLMAALPVATPAQSDLMGRMIALNSSLKSYTATMNAHVQMTSFPNVAFDLTGTYYRREPDRSKLEITSGLPVVAAQFGKLYPHIESPSRWSSLFAVTKQGDDGTTTTMRLVPKVRGNIDHITVKVDDQAATISEYRWDYYNGGWADLRNKYAKVGQYMLVTAQTGHVEEPNYKGDVAATLSDYKINPDLPDSVFAQ